MNTETLEKANALWGKLKSLRFQHDHIKDAARFTYYVKEQGNMLSVPTGPARDILREMLQQEIDRVVAELTALGIEVQ
jgi:hypothetical protein